MENGQEVEREDHDNLLAEGSYSVGSEIKDGYPEFTLGVLKRIPLLLTFGRWVEGKGGGGETIYNGCLAGLKQEVYVVINPTDASERRINDGRSVWVTGREGSSKARMNAFCGERVGKDV